MTEGPTHARMSFSPEATDCVLRLQHEGRRIAQLPETPANCSIGSGLDALRNIACSVEFAAKNDSTIGEVNLFICAAVKPPSVRSSNPPTVPQNVTLVQLWNSIDASEIPLMHEDGNETFDRLMSVVRVSAIQQETPANTEADRNATSLVNSHMHSEFRSSSASGERSEARNEVVTTAVQARALPAFERDLMTSARDIAAVPAVQPVVVFDRMPAGEGVYRAPEVMATKVATWLLNGTGYSTHHTGGTPMWPESYTLISCRLITEALGKVFKEEKHSRGNRGLKYSALLPTTPKIHTVILPLDRLSNEHRKQREADKVVKLILKKAKRTKKGSAFAAFCILMNVEGMNGACSQVLQKFSEEGLGSKGCERRRRVGLRVEVCKSSPSCVGNERVVGANMNIVTRGHD